MKKLQHYFWICLAIAGVGFFIFKVGKRFMTDHLLENNPQRIKAIIIGERTMSRTNRLARIFRTHINSRSTVKNILETPIIEVLQLAIQWK